VLGHPPPTPHTIAIYFVADERPVATPELVRAIAEALGVTTRLVPIPPPLLRWACACAGKAAAFDRLAGSLEVDTAAFRTKFDWRPLRPMAEELADMALARRDVPVAPL
jgi:nucleoside-diphosphate-sugar epimerase